MIEVGMRVRVDSPGSEVDGAEGTVLEQVKTRDSSWGFWVDIWDSGVRWVLFARELEEIK